MSHYLKYSLSAITWSVLCLSVWFHVFAATTQTDDQQLNTIFELLDDEIAKREQESIFKHNDENELEKAISTIHQMWITKFKTPTDYMSDQAIRRDEAATMFYRFVNAMNSLETDMNTNSNCSFPDINQAHSDLISVVTDSCKAGLFYWANGKFLPTSPITNAQAITVMARILEGKKNETNGHWADNYYSVLVNLAVMEWLSMKDKRNYDQTITRWDIAKLLYRVKNELES